MRFQDLYDGANFPVLAVITHTLVKQKSIQLSRYHSADCSVHCRTGKRPGSSLSGGSSSKLIKTEADSTTVSPPAPNAALLTNDGNFLERFKKMQEMQAKGVTITNSKTCSLPTVNVTMTMEAVSGFMSSRQKVKSVKVK